MGCPPKHVVFAAADWPESKSAGSGSGAREWEVLARTFVYMGAPRASHVGQPGCVPKGGEG